MKARKVQNQGLCKRSCKIEPYSIKDGVTQSLLSSFISCRVRTRYQLDGWEGTGTKHALTVGTLVHGVLEDYSKAIVAGLGSQGVSAFIHKSFVKRTKVALPAISSAPATEEFLLSSHKMEAVLQEYSRFWVKDLKRKWFATEEVFDVTWNGFRLRGKVDDGFKSGKKDAWLFETKTSGQMREDELTEALSIDFQSMFYLEAMEKVYPKYNWKGVLYNVIRKPQLRQKKGETTKEFMDRVQEDVAERPEFYFNRFELVFPKEVRVEFKEQLQAKLTDFENWSDGGLPTYRNESACRSRWSCNFLRACAAGKPGRPDYAKTRVNFRELEEEGNSGGKKGGKAKGKKRKVKRRKIKAR